MADTTRRSVRARTNPTTSHHSSASSTSSGRADRNDRNTRTSGKHESPRKSTPSGSLSSEPADDTIEQTIEDGLQTRRSRKRGQEEEETTNRSDEAIEDGDGEEDDGTVRCICGMPDYPGPPQWTEDDKKKSGDLEFITAEDVTEDLAGFFLSCDSCKVWQHGGCVGIKNEDVSPDEYYCEQCRKDLHKIYTALDGQKYSLYLPLQPSYSPPASRTTSFSKEGDGKTRGDRAGSAMTNAKRRSTMNSRDAAYDEEEQLRRAIAASKGEELSESFEAPRRPKRGRSDSEEKQESSKRPKTASRTPSPKREKPAEQADSDDEKARNGGKKIRGAAAKNHSAKEAREERERQRQEAASKRKGRAERRRVDDESEPPEDPNQARTSKTASEADVSKDDNASATAPDTPPIAPLPQANSQHKKGGRPVGKKKHGKNQYTRDRDDGDSPGRSNSRSRDSKDDKDSINGDNGAHKGAKESHRKKVNGAGSGVIKVGWGEMRRKVSNMLDYIAKVQVEMADQSNAFGGAAIEEKGKMLMKGVAGSIAPLLDAEEPGSEAQGPKGNEKAFDDMSLLEMMEFLTRRLIMWQKDYGN